MADVTASRPESSERVRALTAAYRAIAERYAAVEALSRREQELLETPDALDEVRAVLEQKRALLAEIRREEEKISSDPDAWHACAGDLAPHATRDLVAALDEVSRRIERSLALEAECRALLERAEAAPAPCSDSNENPQSRSPRRTPQGGSR